MHFSRILNAYKDDRIKFVWLKDEFATEEEQTLKKKLLKIFTEKIVKTDKYKIDDK